MIKTVIQIIIGVAGYCVWGYMAYQDATLRPEFLHFNILMTIGTIGLVLRDMKTASAEADKALSVDDPATDALVGKTSLPTQAAAVIPQFSVVPPATQTLNQP